MSTTYPKPLKYIVKIGSKGGNIEAIHPENRGSMGSCLSLKDIEGTCWISGNSEKPLFLEDGSRYPPLFEGIVPRSVTYPGLTLEQAARKFLQEYRVSEDQYTIEHV